MAFRFIIFLVVTALMISCKNVTDQLEGENNTKIKAQLLGEWEHIPRAGEFFDEVTFLFHGIAFHSDSMEFYEGFYKGDIDSISRRTVRKYLGNFTSYEIEGDSLFIKNRFNQNKPFRLKFIRQRNDTLSLAINDSTTLIYSRLTYNPDTLPDFDQVIYSSSGCFGTCPVMDLSLDKAGNVLYQGGAFVKPTGFFSGKAGAGTTDYVFTKFRKANPTGLLDNYFVGHTDDETITTTYIKNGKIIKTIQDYGRAATKEMDWAYIPIGELHSMVRLDSLLTDEPFYPRLHYFTVNKGTLILPLEKSECFYFWTELIKSQRTETDFKPVYELTFAPNSSYWRTSRNKALHPKEVTAITSDGRYFKFEYAEDKPVTYDLGYNFIERNFKAEDFREPLSWEHTTD